MGMWIHGWGKKALLTFEGDHQTLINITFWELQQCKLPSKPQSKPHHRICPTPMLCIRLLEHPLTSQKWDMVNWSALLNLCCFSGQLGFATPWLGICANLPQISGMLHICHLERFHGIIYVTISLKHPPSPLKKILMSRLFVGRSRWSDSWMQENAVGALWGDSQRFQGDSSMNCRPPGFRLRTSDKN